MTMQTHTHIHHKRTHLSHIHTHALYVKDDI